MAKKVVVDTTKETKTGGGEVKSWGEMRAAPYNPRRIKSQNLAALKISLLTFGDISGAVYNKRTGNIVCGHQRRKALEKMELSAIEWGAPYEVELGDGETHPKFTSSERLGHVSLPGGARITIREVDWDEIFEKAANIVANSPHLSGEYTQDVVTLLDEIKMSPMKLPPLKLDAIEANVLKTLDGVDKSKEDEEAEHSLKRGADTAQDASDVRQGAYCPLRDQFDVAIGKCSYKCLYCFIATTRAQIAVGSGVRLVSPGAIELRVEEAAARSNLIVTGICIEPTLPEVEPGMLDLLKAAAKKKVNVLISTKNPAGALSIAKNAKFPLELLSVRTAFSMPTREKTAFLEPGAPPLDARIAGIRSLIKAGVGTIIRWQPLFLGYYDGMEEVLSQCPGVERVIVEPFRSFPAGRGYFLRINKALDKDDQNWDVYCKRWERTTGSGKYYGDMNWFDVEPDKLWEQYSIIRTMAHNHGAKFGISSMYFGVPYVRLNDGPYCCHLDRWTDHDVRPSEQSISYLYGTGREKELSCPIMQNMDISDGDYWIAVLDGIGVCNDKRNPILQHPLPKDGVSDKLRARRK